MGGVVVVVVGGGVWGLGKKTELRPCHREALQVSACLQRGDPSPHREAGRLEALCAVDRGARQMKSGLVLGSMILFMEKHSLKQATCNYAGPKRFKGSLLGCCLAWWRKPARGRT